MYFFTASFFYVSCRIILRNVQKITLWNWWLILLHLDLKSVANLQKSRQPSTFANFFRTVQQKVRCVVPTGERSATDTEFQYYINEGVYGSFRRKLLGNTIPAPSVHKVSGPQVTSDSPNRVEGKAL